MRRARNDLGCSVGVFLGVFLLLSILSVIFSTPNADPSATLMVWSISIGIATLVWFIRRPRRNILYPKHRCRVCQYDLRGTPDRCPECGTISTRSRD